MGSADVWLEVLEDLARRPCAFARTAKASSAHYWPRSGRLDIDLRVPDFSGVRARQHRGTSSTPVALRNFGGVNAWRSVLGRLDACGELRVRKPVTPGIMKPSNSALQGDGQKQAAPESLDGRPPYAVNCGAAHCGGGGGVQLGTFGPCRQPAARRSGGLLNPFGRVPRILHRDAECPNGGSESARH